MIEDNIESAHRLENAAATNNIAVGRAGIKTAIETVSRNIVDMNTLVEKLQNKLSEEKATLAETRELVATMETDIEKERELNQIRKEQAESLAKKHAANYHSSWMGLYRPLKEESRIGLAVAAVGFFLIAIILIVYLVQINLWTGIAATTAAASVGIPDVFSGFGVQKNRIIN